MAPLTTCLWFDGNADEAADFYVGIFPNSRRGEASEFSEDAPGETGTTMVATFELDGSSFMALNGGPDFQFSPAISFVVNCETQEEIDSYWERLGINGTPAQCGWLTDQFGVSWQIVPRRLSELMSDPDEAKANRVMRAMLSMVKLDIATLEAAAN
jgi:predicted 3-demethylubiquinone-9 3-methyltransferase (glyoxalase superfamily)